MYLESGVFEFENGYTVFSDVLYLFVLLGLPLAIFGAVRRSASSCVLVTTAEPEPLRGQVQQACQARTSGRRSRARMLGSGG
jgi:hypothetical protein